MKKYYLLEQGQKKGPFSLEELKSFGISSSSHVWTSGMEDWQEAGNLEELSELLQEIPPPIPPMPKTYLFEAILTTIFCCLPTGIVSIINALNVSEAYKIGNYTKSKENSENAEEWCEITFGIGIVIFLLPTVIFLIIKFSNYAYIHNALPI